MTSFTRTGLLRRSVAGGAVLASASLLTPLVEAASAAPPDGDLAYLRLLIATELLEVDFASRALAAGKLGSESTATFKELLADDQAHSTGLASLLTGAGQTPATADDITFIYPRGSFDSEAAILKLADTLEDLSLGAYLGAVQNVQTPRFRLPIGQIGANEAQHVSALAQLSGRPLIGPAFAPSLQMDSVSAALDTYES